MVKVGICMLAVVLWVGIKARKATGVHKVEGLTCEGLPHGWHEVVAG